MDKEDGDKIADWLEDWGDFRNGIQDTLDEWNKLGFDRQMVIRIKYQDYYGTIRNAQYIRCVSPAWGPTELAAQLIMGSWHNYCVRQARKERLAKLKKYGWEDLRKVMFRGFWKTE